MSRVLPLPDALEEIRKKLYPMAHSKQQFAALLGRDTGISPLTIKEWQQGDHYPQAAALRKLKELARRAGIEIAGSPASYPEVTLGITAAIDAMSARFPMSHADMARRCGVRKSTLSSWRGKGILPREDNVRDRLRELAAQVRVRIEGL